MHTTTEEPLVAAERDLSLIRGGLFYRAQKAAQLIPPDEWLDLRRPLIAIAIGWFPIFLITAFTHPDALISLLKDYRVHSRMLIAVPALLIGEFLIESRFRMVVDHIAKSALLEGPDLVKMNDIISQILRLRDSMLPELAILSLLIIHGTVSFTSALDETPWIATGSGSSLHLTAAGWYAILVSASLFQFLLGLALWKWLLWTIFAFRLSRLDLKLVPTHPDSHGGLGFLSLTPIAFTPIAFAATAVIAGTWRHQLLHTGGDLMGFKLPAIVLAVIIALLALGPLLFFVPLLSNLRRQGVLDYGALAQVQVRSFHDKWVRGGMGHENEFLAAPESRALASFGQSYQHLVQLNPFPADKGALISLALSVATPMLPLILTVIPIAVVLKILVKALH